VPHQAHSKPGECSDVKDWNAAAKAASALRSFSDYGGRGTHLPALKPNSTGMAISRIPSLQRKDRFPVHMANKENLQDVLLVYKF